MSRVAKATITVVKTHKTRQKWQLLESTWQLPCGCIGADYWTCDDQEESYCTCCGRGWKHMGSFGYCRMLDGGPQGQPVLVLKEKVHV